ncbi:MAG TPA: hypothetical protein VNO52_16715 [Methylomirabilota bacterium]|nr:hypothetical protein [Methylomirabilota bacterium]
MKSETLHIQITEAGQTRVSLSFGAGAAEYLPKLVPPPVRERLAARSIDLAAIAERARTTGFAPGELFLLEDGPKTVRVWLD